MKRIFTGFIILCFWIVCCNLCFATWWFDAQTQAVTARKNAGGAAIPDVYWETFDTASGCDTTCPTFNVTNSSTIDPDYAVIKYGATGESLRLNIHTAGDDCYSSAKDITTQTGEHYITVRFYVDSVGTTFQNIDIIRFTDNSARPNFYLYFRDDGSGIDMTFTSNFGSFQFGEGVALDTWHHFVAKIPSDGSTTVKYKYNGGEETELSGSAQNYDSVSYIMGESAASAAAQIYIDNIGVCSSSGANCGW